jgi:hypothetical protein
MGYERIEINSSITEEEEGEPQRKSVKRNDNRHGNKDSSNKERGKS